MTQTSSPNTRTAPPAPDDTPFTEAERGAMRAYLQRCEVRLSTLHRIATAFVGGAGLLLLIPIFLRDVVEGILLVWLRAAELHFETLSAPIAVVLTLAMYSALLYPFLLSLAVPIYGVYLLLKDIVHFYFTIYMPDFPHDLLHPTFALTGVAFSPDESPRVKRAVMRHQYAPHQADYMMPFSEGRREQYFDALERETNGEIIPRSRRLGHLHALDALPADHNPYDVRRFNVALGIARSLDRDLAQEVAITEMALVRHVMYLRRLVLRYVKTLLMFLWTTIISFVMLPFLNDARFPTFVILGLGYTVWALAVMRIASWPIQWIYRHRSGAHGAPHIDTQLTRLERMVRPYARAAIVVTLAGLALAVVDLLL